MDLWSSFVSKPVGNPFLLASGPPTASYDMIARAFDAGWAGAVTKTLISTPVKNMKNRFASLKHGADIIAFKNIELLSELSPETWYVSIRKLKLNFPDKLIIASIMGDALTSRHWLDLAHGSQESGADMIELNFSCPHGYPEQGQGAAIGQRAGLAANIVEWLKNDAAIQIPVIPKLSPAVADISHIGRAVAEAGADGICAINTFPSLMGFNLKTLEPWAAVNGYTTPGGCSGMMLKPIALRCVADLCKNPGIPVMACGGIWDGFDAAEFILLGAPVVQVCTSVMLNGINIIEKMTFQLERFMAWHNFETIKSFCGSALHKVKPYADLDAGFVVRACIDPEKCQGCGSCYISCRDGGYQAIQMIGDTAFVDDDRCEGCSLCFQVCSNDAVKMVEAT
ncbi:MAG: NAD-dependent dihydropyrimidine dehydrogenase subunit PreA [Bacteroidales bacterium]